VLLKLKLLLTTISTDLILTVEEEAKEVQMSTIILRGVGIEADKVEEEEEGGEPEEITFQQVQLQMASEGIKEVEKVVEEGEGIGEEVEVVILLIRILVER